MLEAQAEETYSDFFEREPQVKAKLNSRQFPKPGGNRRISDIDLRAWENLYMKSLKILKMDNLYKDVAENMQRFELLIEYQWDKKDKKLVHTLDKILYGNQQQYQMPASSIQRVRYHMYQIYILGNQIDTYSLQAQAQASNGQIP